MCQAYLKKAIKKNNLAPRNFLYIYPNPEIFSEPVEFWQLWKNHVSAHDSPSKRRKSDALYKQWPIAPFFHNFILQFEVYFIQNVAQPAPPPRTL